MTPGSIALVCFEGGSATSATGPLEIFKHAAAHLERSGTAAPPAVAVVTPGDTAVTLHGCVSIRPTAALASVERPALVFLAGMGGDAREMLRRHRAVVDWLLAAREEGAAVAAVCPSQALLARAGLLDGRAAAVHWSLLDDFRARWPAVGWRADRVVVEDGGLSTSCGASSALDLALRTVDCLFGREAMAACARWLLADLPRARQNVPPPPFAAAPPPPGSLEPAMERVGAWLREHFREPVRFEELAERHGMSWRTFQRRFRAAFADTPRAHLQRLRLAAARQALENEALAVDLVARRVGYDDAAFFRALFKRHTGMTPSRYRESFRFRPPGAAAEPPGDGAPDAQG